MHMYIPRMKYAMQNPSLLISMIRYILIAKINDWKFAQQCITVMTVVIYCIHTICTIMRFTCKKFMLPLLRPMRCMPNCMQIMSSLYFLQKNDVSFHCMNGLLHLMDTRTIAKDRNAFMNVVGRDAQFHSFILALNFTRGKTVLRKLQHRFCIRWRET